MTETTPATPADDTAVQLAQALDAIRAEGAAELGGGGPERLNWPATAQYLIDHPPYTSYNPESGAAQLRGLWYEFPLQTPFGEVHATLMRTHRTEGGGVSFRLEAQRGGSFIVNGKQYAPEADSFLLYVGMDVEHVRSWDGREAWRVRADNLTDSARAKVAEWIEAEGAALILDPARVAARDLYDAAVSAASARKRRDEAHAAEIAAEADWQASATHAAETLADALHVIDGEAV